jgi:hypothetical protein
MRPGGYEKLFARAVQVLGSGRQDLEALAAVGKEYDLDVVGPMIAEDRPEASANQLRAVHRRLTDQKN